MPLTSDTLFNDDNARDPFIFPSRRSVVHSTHGIVSCTQPLAAKCGLDVLRAGGNAADAAVAVAAGLNMTEPCSTGIGGDMFILFWDAKAKTVKALNGSGRSGHRYTLQKVRATLGLDDSDKTSTIPQLSALAVTVPGAAAGWVDTVEKFGSGKLDMATILAPAIQLGEEGFPVSEISGYIWMDSEKILRQASPNYPELLKRDPSAENGVRAPRPGEIMRNPTLAETFRTLAAHGKPGFYTGRIADAIVQALRDRNGLLEPADLAHHLELGTDSVAPLSLPFSGQGLAAASAALRIWEHPPNGQGIVALMTLGILQQLERQGRIPTFAPPDFNTAPYLHALIEALRIAFADGNWFVADPDAMPVPPSDLLADTYLAERAKLFDPNRAVDLVNHGEPSSSSSSPALRSSDTVYFSVADADGNAASFINSNFTHFGTAIVPAGCGFALQNRGCNFSLAPGHPNQLAPDKRPYHTIIPAVATNLADGSLHSSFGVMGGFMQPQGHVQVLMGQVVAGLSPQQALDAPRFFVCGRHDPVAPSNEAGWAVNLEHGMPAETIEGLRRLGHEVNVVSGFDRAMFGRGQIIRHVVDPVDKTPIWSAGSDPRGDGAAYPL